MAKAEQRYCRKCSEYTLQDKTTMDSRDPDGAERVFLGVVTMGFAELMRDPAWECQKCGNVTSR